MTNPIFAAVLPAWTPPATGGVLGIPNATKKAAKMMIAKIKLATGPARTIRNRCHQGLRWKDFDLTSGGSFASKSGWLAGFMSPTKRT